VRLDFDETEAIPTPSVGMRNNHVGIAWRNKREGNNRDGVSTVPGRRLFISFGTLKKLIRKT
jgi:hypothetical protein